MSSSRDFRDAVSEIRFFFSGDFFKDKIMKKTVPRTNRLIDNMILTVRGQKVILDSDLAALYGVLTFRFNEAVKRNRKRFPDDFMFQLTTEELAALTSQFAMSKIGRGRFPRRCRGNPNL